MVTSIVLPKFRFTTRHHEETKDDTSHSTRSARSAMSDDLQLEIIQETEGDCIREIKEFFRHFDVRVPKAKIFRYACFHDFDAEEAIDHIRDDDYNPYLRIKIEDLEEQFQSNTLFPIPNLRTRKNTEVVYMRPSPFFNGSKSSCDKFVAGLCYILNDLSQTEEQCRNGVTVIADMQGINKEKFNKEQYKKLIFALQGEMVPTRVEDLIIVSPPSWFTKISKMTKRTMSKDFAKRVHTTNDERLYELLMGDYEMFLPDVFSQGLADVSEIAEDYVDLKMVQERQESP